MDRVRRDAESALGEKPARRGRKGRAGSSQSEVRVFSESPLHEDAPSSKAAPDVDSSAGHPVTPLDLSSREPVMPPRRPWRDDEAGTSPAARTAARRCSAEVKSVYIAEGTERGIMVEVGTALNFLL